MTENPEARAKETHSAEEQLPPRKPDGVISTKIGKKTYVTEVFFDHDSKDTFQDKLIKVILAEQPE